jgi:hypothetical protein
MILPENRLPLFRIMLEGKEWAVKLGDFTALGLPTEGGAFHRKVARGGEH